MRRQMKTKPHKNTKQTPTQNNQKKNQTTAYIQSVAKQLGVYPDTVIDIEERGVLTVFIKAVIRMENGIQPYSDELIQQGIELCQN